MLDMYLSSHLSTLYTMIRNKALIQVWMWYGFQTLQQAKQLIDNSETSFYDIFVCYCS